MQIFSSLAVIFSNVTVNDFLFREWRYVSDISGDYHCSKKERKEKERKTERKKLAIVSAMFEL